jgi:hypothetical protein
MGGNTTPARNIIEQQYTIMSETTETIAAPAPEAAVPAPEAPAPAPVKTADESKAEAAAQAKADALAKAQAAQDAINKRIEELKACKGKFYRPKSGGPTYSKVLDYGGIGKLMGGIEAHLFKVEQWNPRLLWTPPATKFFEENEEFDASELVTTKTSLIQ